MVLGPELIVEEVHRHPVGRSGGRVGRVNRRGKPAKIAIGLLKLTVPVRNLLSGPATGWEEFHTFLVAELT